MFYFCELIILLITFVNTSSYFSYHGQSDYRKLSVSSSRLPKFFDIDMIEVYHLRSFPILLIETSAGSFETKTSGFEFTFVYFITKKQLCSQLKKNSNYLHIYIYCNDFDDKLLGLALRSTTTSEVLVIEYLPVNFSACFLPQIITNDKETNLIWDKRATIFYKLTIDTNYWEQSTFLSRINGIAYKIYVKWIENYINKNIIFSPHSICSNDNALSCFTIAETWDTFFSDSLQKFAELSIRINAVIPPRVIESRVISHMEPIEVIAVKVNDSYNTSHIDPYHAVNNSKSISNQVSYNTMIDYYNNLMSCMEGKLLI